MINFGGDVCRLEAIIGTYCLNMEFGGTENLLGLLM